MGWRVRDFLLLVGSGALAAYLVVDHWLRPLIDGTPEHVWALAAWTWFSWTGWWLLQRLAR